LTWKKTLRFRLTMGSIAIILVANTTVAVVTELHISNVLLEEVQTRVRLDLNSARQIYSSYIDGIARFLRAIALDQVLAESIEKNNRDNIFRLIDVAYAESKFDMLTVVGPDGRVIARAHNKESAGDDLSKNPIVARALLTRAPVTGSVVVSYEHLQREGADLARRAYFEIHETPAARPSTRKVESDGMVVGAAVPLIGPNGKFYGVLFGGNLLNYLYRIVDTIKNELFQNQIYQGKDIGTATIFQGDLRISTNVKNADGTRAIGTRMSTEVADDVLVRGKPWADRAFVVNDWYISAYEPIRNPDNQIIGALYVGLLAAPFDQTQLLITRVFLVVMATITMLSLLLLYMVTNLVLRPVSKIVEMSQKVIDGDRTARVGIRPPGEMGLVCLAIDRMADAVVEREQRLEQATRQQIGQSEKLASIGRLSAGIAHEINNPLTGVLTFAHLLREKSNMDTQDKQDLEVIIRETTRVREIVRGLLDFARESPSRKVALDINEVIRTTMKLVRSQKEFDKVVVVENLVEGLPPVWGDKNQLQQVLLNLSLNACEAMPVGGTLAIGTATQDDQVRITVSDTGCGIPPEHLKQIFDPFFTTKPVGKGTGLGLSVSYGIIQQHGGTLEVESELGKGSIFTINLRHWKDGKQAEKGPA
jgi:two-component system NtrC family sensor kinase